jgi:hypothetical protein
MENHLFDQDFTVNNFIDDKAIVNKESIKREEKKEINEEK